MNILIFGVPCVGKSTMARLIAEQLNYEFYDLDDELKKIYGMTHEAFCAEGTLESRDAIRCGVVNRLVEYPNDKVIAVTALSYPDGIRRLFDSEDAICIELRDSVENIYNRLTFYDENDVLEDAGDYKDEHMYYYLDEINSDLLWYGHVYSDIKNKFDFKGMTAEEAAPVIIKRFKLARRSKKK